MPGANQVHYSKVLTDVAVQFRPPELVARDLLKPVPVQNEQDVYPVWDKSLFDIVDDIRADGAESNETNMGWKYTPYQLHEHALKDRITEREKKNADDPADLEAAKTEGVKQKVLNRMEYRVFGTGGFARASGNVINSRNFDWSNPSSAQVRRDIDLLKEDVEVASGMTPNTIVLTPQVGRAIMRTAEWRDEAKYTNDLRSDNDIPSQFYGLNVVLVGSLMNTAKKGQARSLARLMGEDVLVCYNNPNPKPYRDLTWAVTLFTEEYASTWFEDKRRATMIEYGYIYELQLVARECAALGTSVLTS